MTGTPAFPDRVRDYVARTVDAVKPHTAEEFFTVILHRAALATEAGNYGIGAAAVVRSDEVELISIGWSTIVTDHDPLGHAETNAIRQLKTFLSAPQADQLQLAAQWTDLPSVLASSKQIFLRPAITAPAAEIFSSLEPCPMCTVAIMNAGIERVVIAAPDQPAGALGSGRLQRLPPLWPALAEAQQMRVEFVETEQSDHDDGVPRELLTLLHDAFWSTKESVDQRLIHGALFSPEMLAVLPQLMRQLS